MARAIPLCPYDLGKNDCYLYLHDTYEKDRIDKWRLDDLLEEFTRKEVLDCFDKEIIVKCPGDRVQLSFNYVGTLAYNIRKLVEVEIRNVQEIIRSFSKQGSCSSQRLTNLLSFMIQFDQMYSFNAPASGVTYLVSGPDTPKWEKAVDLIYLGSEDLAIKWIYQLQIDDTVEECRKNLSR